ncbi:4Fe-4S dicluster domain-containing protein [Trichlorobacter ammonificans]|uniref:NADPH-dependent glutamate synthase, iron-sulfur cluster-binding subunit n=1 Tax=Trichlorobacter ammonificans TaxID=2916410 RepID=A0ABM9D6L7_9BACT|nr:4Fe-4S dicluster domain-containing protein [Trichlorobacter ammonificans]CAH2030874.1 NADPH-dependent glutamate synthase, iron-sulfur cluster-binding subunit [Trichlorobacter ammonificans]
MKRIYSIEEACIGCHLCEVACITSHSRSKDPITAFLHEKERPLARCVVEEAEEGVIAISTRCRHCDEPACVEACIAGAIQKQEDGRVIVDTDKCVGCWSCVMACPFGAISRDLKKKKSNKCDLCPDRDTPACVAACPNRALIYMEGD